jgi:hypothetical protein
VEKVAVVEIVVMAFRRTPQARKRRRIMVVEELTI